MGYSCFVRENELLVKAVKRLGIVGRKMTMLTLEQPAFSKGLALRLYSAVYPFRNRSHGLVQSRQTAMPHKAVMGQDRITAPQPDSSATAAKP